MSCVGSSCITVPLSWNEKIWSLWSSHILVLPFYTFFPHGWFFFFSISFPSTSAPPSCPSHLDCLLFFFLAGMEMSRAQGKRTLMEEEEEEDEDAVGLGLAEDERKKAAASKKGSGGAGSTPPCCQVDNCTSDMSDAKKYHKRHRVCEHHAKAPVVLIAGTQERFCQQCSRSGNPNFPSTYLWMKILSAPPPFIDLLAVFESNSWSSS